MHPTAKQQIPVMITRPLAIFTHAVRPTAVPMLGSVRRVYAPERPVNRFPIENKLGQLVTVNPNVQVTVKTGLENYLFPVGLMAAGGASFLVGTVVPPAFKIVTTLAGLGLIGWGVYVLIKGGTSSGAAQQPGAPAATPPPPVGATPVQASPQPFVPPTTPAFNQLQIAMISPNESDVVKSTGTFLGIGTPKMPIQLQVYNPTGEQVTFTLEFEWDEYPSFADVNLTPKHGTANYQVTLGPGEAKNETFSLPLASGGFSSAIDVALQVYKRRVANENRFLVQNQAFKVT